MIGDLTKAQMEQVLRKEIHGHLACHSKKDLYLVPIAYAYRDGAIYSHTYEGKKVRMMRKNPKVCFQVDAMSDLRTWKSVILTGHFEELTGKEASKTINILSHRLQKLLDRGEYALSFVTSGTSHLSRRNGRKVVLYRIRIDAMTGRFERS